MDLLKRYLPHNSASLRQTTILYQSVFSYFSPETLSLHCYDEENMWYYLCYYTLDMLDLGLEESKTIHNVFNWFFKILQRMGGYPKPKGYKTFEEKRLEEEKKL